MIPYVDHNGIVWRIEPPGTDINIIQDDGSYRVGPADNWVAFVGVDAYGHTAGSMLAIATDERDIRSCIDDYVLSAGKPDAPTNANPPSAAPAGGGWLWLLAFLWLLDEKKRR